MARNDWKTMALNLQREVTKLRRERLLLAQLAAETPQFFNPLVAMGAQVIRNRVLAEYCLAPAAAGSAPEDGTHG